MDKNKWIKRLIDGGIVAVVRAKSSEQALKIARACIDGGINSIEITFTVPNADKAISDLCNNFSNDELLVGAGTIYDLENAKLALSSGAKFIVGPCFDLEVAKLCVEKKIPYIPGCMTITEMVNASRAGADIIKLFPGSAFGPDFIKAVKGPLPNLLIMPTGGVSLQNVQEWFKKGAIGVGVGGELTAPAKRSQYDEITEIAKEFVRLIKEVRP